MKELVKAKIDERPKCLCGQPMKVILYKGYYEGFRYWACTNKDCPVDIDNYKEDDDWRGDYAY